MMKCQHCGNEIESGNKFCNSCGAPVTEEKTVTVETPVAEKTTVEEPVVEVKEEPKVETKEEPKVEATPVQPAEPKENPVNGILEKVKAIPKKTLAIGGGVIAGILVICLLVSMLGGAGGAKEVNHVVYLKDGELSINMLKGKDSFEITSDFAGDEEAEYMYDEAYNLVTVTPDGKKVIYPDEYDYGDDSFKLFYRSTTDEKGKEEEIAKQVYSYRLSEDGKKMIYRCEKGLYEYDFKDSEKIDSDAYRYWTSKDFKTILYSDDEGTLYKKTFGKDDAEKIEKEAYVEYVSEDLNTIVFTKDDKLFIKNGNKEAEKIDKDVVDVLAGYDNGHIYFVKEEIVTTTVGDYIEDDLLESDAAMVQPEYPYWSDFAPEYPYSFNWDSIEAYAGCTTYDEAYDLYQELYDAADEAYDAAYDAYYDAYDLWSDKEDRDYYREYYFTDEISTTKRELYYYDGKEAVLVADDIASDYVASKGDQDEIITVMIEESGEAGKVKFSEIENIYDFEYEIEEQLEASATLAMVKGNEVTKFDDVEDIYDVAISADAKTIFVLSETDYDDYSHTLSKVTVSNGMIEEIDDGVLEISTAENGDYVYSKEDGDHAYEVFINGESVAKDLYTMEFVSQEKFDKFYYIKDGKDNEGTLCYYDGKEKEIADDVYYGFKITAEGGVLYFEDYDSGDATGTLFYSENGKEGTEIDDDVMAILSY